MLVGALVGESGERERLLGVTLCSVLVYWFGMAANDVVDLQKDRLGAPQRPLASGALSLVAAIGVCVALVAGAVLVGVWLQITAAVVGLLALVVLYDFGGKKVPILGNVLMGSCRAGNFLLGAVALAGWGIFESDHSASLWVGAALLGFYVAGVTAVSVLEDREFRRGRFLATALLLLTVPVALVLRSPADLWNWANALWLVALLGWAVRTACRAAPEGPHGADWFVRQALSGIFLVDAGCLLALSPNDFPLHSEVLILYALFVLTWVWKKRWFAT